MISAHLREGAEKELVIPALSFRGVERTYGQLADMVTALTPLIEAIAPHRVGLFHRDPLQFMAGAVALEALRTDTVLLPDLDVGEASRLLDEFQWDATTDGRTVIPRPHREGAEIPSRVHPIPRLTILTSGTTGRPKAIEHTWATLARPVRRDPGFQGTRWFCAYPLHLYAGTQMFLQSFLNWATLVIPPSFDPREVGGCLRDSGAEYASATPTFWRRLLFFGSLPDLRAARLKQITLGGEPVTKELLDMLHDVFPQARIAHIFASTELGRLFSVTDGREGFPAAYLEHPPEEGTQLEIRDGQLYARSRNAAASGEEGDSPHPSADLWVPTGDRVEIHGDRVIFRGRMGELINVGGLKVSPAKVEAALRGVDGLADLRVYARRSSLAGQLVAADLVLRPGAAAKTVEGAILLRARESLLPHEVPRFFRVVDEIPRSTGFKNIRMEPD